MRSFKSAFTSYRYRVVATSVLDVCKLLAFDISGISVTLPNR